MEKIEMNNILDDLIEKNNKLSTDLLFAQKCIQLLERHRNCLISFDNNCKCDQNIDNKNVFKLLEDEYNCVFHQLEINNNQKQLDKYIEPKLEFNETNVENNQFNNQIKSIEKDSEKSKTTVKCILFVETYSKDKQLLQNNNSIDDCDQNQNSSIDNQFSNESNDETNDDSNYDINEEIIKKKTKSERKTLELSVEEILKKIEEKKVVTEIDKNEPLIKVLRPKHSLKGSRQLYGYSCNFDNICQYISCKRYRVLNHIQSTHTLQNPLNCDESDYQTINEKTKERVYHELKLNEILKKIEDKQVVTEIDKNEPLMTVLRPKHWMKGGRTLYGYSCNICQYISCKRIRVLNHIQSMHTMERRFSCDECQFETKTIQNLNIHKRRVHEKAVKPHSCVWPECGKSFYNARELKRHELVHSQLRPYVCEWPGCEATFKYSTKLTYHLRTHTGEKPNKCDWPGCDYRCADISDIKKHKVKHTGIKPHVCVWPGCGRSFCRLKGLKTHMLSHNELRPFACEWPGCEYKCRDNYQLKNHKLKHTGTKNHVCNWPECDQSFQNVGALRLHIQGKHLNDKPFGCLFTGCQYRFISKHAMFKHFQTHKKAVCDRPKCGKSFRTFKELEKHCLDVHKGEECFKCPFEGCERTYEKRAVQKTHFYDTHLKK